MNIFPGTCLPAGKAQRDFRILCIMDKIYFIYAIKSKVDGRIYVGMTNNINRRLQEHNAGNTQSTKHYRPWTIIYLEKMEDRINARKKEKYLKSGCGKEFLKFNISRVAQR